MARIVGCDIGSTFIDLVMLENDPAAEAAEGVRVVKLPSDTDHMAQAVMAAFEAAGAVFVGLDAVVHGCDAATQALARRQFSRCGLLVTAGWSNELEPPAKSDPMVPLARRHEITEGIDTDGFVTRPLDEDEVASAGRALAADGVESIVVHFRNAVANPMHETRTAEILAEVAPGVLITLGSSHETERRDFERGTTALANGAIRPSFERYLRRLERELERRGYGRTLLVMQGNGGAIAADLAMDSPARTVLASRAASMMAAGYIAAASGHPDAMVLDLGGASADIGVIESGAPLIGEGLTLGDGLPVAVPLLDTLSVPYGAGSIGAPAAERPGALALGPANAGANPGPVCVGLGGTHVTVTDAALLLGYLAPEHLFGTTTPADRDTVIQAFERELARPLNVAAERAAGAMVSQLCDAVASSIGEVLAAKRLVAREMLLIAQGGAGPLFASRIARRLGFPKVLIPARPGVAAAVGCLIGDVRHDYLARFNMALDELDMDALREAMEAHERAGRRTATTETQDVVGITASHHLDCRLHGSGDLLSLRVEDTGVTQLELRRAFEADHAERFGRPAIGVIEVVNLRTTVVGRRRGLTPSDLIDRSARRGSLAEASLGKRTMWTEMPPGWVEAPVYAREAMPRNAAFIGPAVIHFADTTLVVDPLQHVAADDAGNLIVTLPH